MLTRIPKGTKDVLPAESPRLQAVEALMQYRIPMNELPEALEISTLLIPDEMEETTTRNIKLKLTDISKGGGAFHEKKDKNKKVNLGGPTKRKPPKSKPKNRGQQKQKAKKFHKGLLPVYIAFIISFYYIIRTFVLEDMRLFSKK